MQSITFVALATGCGCEVHAFDPTPRSIAFVKEMDTPLGFHFHPVGVWWRQETPRFYAPHNPAFVSHSVKKIWHSDSYFEADSQPVRQLMEQLGHDRLDLRKLDIEGAETEVIANILDEGIHPRVVCVEFDQPRKMVGNVRHLLRSGYSLCHADRWNYTFVRSDLTCS